MLTSTPWQATGIAGADGTMQAPVASSAPTLTFDVDAVAGNASCNRYFGSFELDGATLTFGPLASTEMFCADPGVMEQEQAYLTALASVDAWSIENEELTLTAGGEPVVTYAAISQDLAGTSWQLVGYNNGQGGFASVTGSEAVTAAFSDDGVSGSSGCNSYTASYEAGDDGSITIGPAAGTRMMCEDDAVMDQEARYLAVLELADTYLIGPGSLEIFDEGGTRLLQYVAIEG